MAITTKRALANSLKILLSANTLDKITVKEIVSHCGVNRQTFYYHFQDIYDLLDFLFVEEAERTLEGKKTLETWEDGFMQAFLYVKGNRTLILNAYNSLGREHLERYLYHVVYELLYGVIEEQADGLKVSEEDKQYIANFYKYAFVGIALEWIRMGMKENPETIVHKLSKFLAGDFKNGLLKFSKL